MAGEERTEAATPRKLQTLCDDGKVSKSPEVASALSILAGDLTIYAFGGTGWGYMRAMITDGLSNISRADLTDTSLMQLSITAGTVFFTLMAPLLIAMPLIGIISNVGQSGLMLTTKPLMPDLSRLNPITGFTRMFSIRTVVELIKTTLKV